MKKIRIRIPLYVDPHGDNDITKRERPKGVTKTPFKKGTRFAARENMPEDSHNRRMKGLFKTWGQRFRKNKGLPLAGGSNMPLAKRTAAQIREKRRKIKLTIAKEAREVQEMARQSVTQAMEVVRDILVNGERQSDKLAAANIVFERAHGKATQVNVNENVNRNGNKDEVSSAELDKRIEEAVARVEELTGREKKPAESPKRPVNLRQRNRDTGSSKLH